MQIYNSELYPNDARDYRSTTPVNYPPGVLINPYPVIQVIKDGIPAQEDRDDKSTAARWEEALSTIIKSEREMPRISIPERIKRVIYNDPCTIVLWKDGTKTVVRCDRRDMFDKEKGLAMAIVKRICGNTGSYYEFFKEHAGEY